jgi:hypothetical protein
MDGSLSSLSLGGSVYSYLFVLFTGRGSRDESCTAPSFLLSLGFVYGPKSLLIDYVLSCYFEESSFLLFLYT